MYVPEKIERMVSPIRICAGIEAYLTHDDWLAWSSCAVASTDVISERVSHCACGSY